jgi:DNA-binding GntR family transcriptional regulator
VRACCQSPGFDLGLAILLRCGSTVNKPAGKGLGKNAKARHRPRGTGASSVYESLKTKILNLELKPGTLLDETELSRQYHLSRSPVREALIRLSAEGLVETPRNRTSMVSQLDFSALPAYFDAMQLLYRLSARLAAKNRTKAGVAVLKDIEGALERAHEQVDVLSIVQLNRDFHAAIADMTGNPFIMSWMKGLLDQGQRVFRLYLASFGDRVPLPKLSQHHAMIQAIERGDAAGAERAGKADAQGLIEEVVHALGNLPSADLDLEEVAVRAIRRAV